MATTTVLTNKGSSIINKASKDGAKCVISRVITSTHYENLPTDLAAKAPHWWDGAEGTVTGLSLVNASLDVKAHWDARQDAQPVKSIGLMVKREGDEKDYLLYAESYSNTAVTLDHALDKIFSLPINAPAETFDAIGNTMNAEVNNAIGGGSVDTGNLGASLYYDSTAAQIELRNTRDEAISSIYMSNLGASLYYDSKAAEIGLRNTSDVVISSIYTRDLGSSLYYDRDAAQIVLRNTKDEEISGIDTGNLGSSLYYDRDAALLELRNTSGAVISRIDATAFIKDGMLDSVTVSGGNLNFVFNTDAGKETISIPLTKFFDASAYYTKAEIDGTFLNAVTYNADTNSLNFASEDGTRTVSVSLD